jgi:MFS family permease
MEIGTFRAFKSRNYRLFFGGQFVSLIGTWMQKTAVSWVVYALTHDTRMLGASLFASQFPSFVLTVFGGVAADRYNRHTVLLITQVASMIQALALAVLVWGGHYNVWMILGLSAVLGVINAFDVPARQSLVYEMVEDKSDLPNAIALNSSMVNLARIIGPGLAGFVLIKLGDDMCFFLNAASFVAVIFSLTMMRLPKFVRKESDKNAIKDLVDGFNYIKNTPSLAFIIIMLGLISLFVLPYSSLIPYYARDVFRGTAKTFGYIDSAIGMGAVGGAIFLASLKPGSNLKKVLAINTLIFGAGLLLFSHEHIYPLALVFATVSGFGMMSQIAISNTIIQTTADVNMRGRVISFYAMAFFGMQPLGGLIIGFVSKYAGTMNTVLAEGVIAVMIGLLHLQFLRKAKAKAKVKPVTGTQQETVHAA